MAAGPGGRRLSTAEERSGAVSRSAMEVVLRGVGQAYAGLIAEEGALLLVQAHALAAAVSESAVREVVRRGYARLAEYVRAVSGGGEAQVQRFFALGMLCHLVMAVGAVDAPWARTLSAGVRRY